MYTRCPSCRSEISFEPPANINSLPEGYKHRIKCPNCGVTIGVKIPRADAYIEPQPVFRPANPHATSFEPVYQAGPVETVADTRASKRVKIKADKKSGRGRNALMLIISLAFVAFAIIGYLVKTKVINPDGWIIAFGYFDGISPWKLLVTDFAGFKAAFDISIATGLLSILPMVLFTLAALNVVVSFISLIGGKYGRAFNVVISVLMALCAVCVLFTTYFAAMEVYRLAGMSLPASELKGYFEGLNATKFYLLYAGAGLGALQFILSLFFMKSLKRKRAA